MSASSLTEPNDSIHSSKKKQTSFSRSILFAITFWFIVGVFMYGMCRLLDVIDLTELITRMFRF